MDFKIRRVAPNVYSLTFDKRYELCMSLVRIQEFYESPSDDIRGKYFTLERFIDYWSKEMGEGVFDYPAKWNGFNFPGAVLIDWMERYACHGSFGGSGWRPKEIEVLDALLERIAKDNGLSCDPLNLRLNGFCKDPDCCDDVDFKEILSGTYIIGTNKQDKGRLASVNHELCHAFYTLYPKYRKRCMRLLKSLCHSIEGQLIRKRAENKLVDLGYCQDVVADELQAYFSTAGYGDELPSIDEFQEHFKSFKKTVNANPPKKT